MHLTDTVSVNKMHLTDTVSVNNVHLTDTVPQPLHRVGAGRQGGGPHLVGQSGPLVKISQFRSYPALRKAFIKKTLIVWSFTKEGVTLPPFCAIFN